MRGYSKTMRKLIIERAKVMETLLYEPKTDSGDPIELTPEEQLARNQAMQKLGTLVSAPIEYDPPTNDKRHNYYKFKKEM